MRRRDLTLIALFCVVLAAGLTWTNATLVGKPRLADRLLMHDQVLAHQAPAGYQTDSFLVAQLTQWLSGATGLSLGFLFNPVWALGYLAALGGCAFWLWEVFRDRARVTLGLLTVAFYAALMLAWSYHHTQDPLAAGLFAVCLGLMVRGKLPALLMVALAAGFLWDKQGLLGPVVGLYLVQRGEWRRGLLWGLLATLAGAIGPVLFRLTLGSPPLPPGGLAATYGGQLHLLPVVLSRHALLLGLPLLGAFSVRWRAPRALWCALMAYAGLIVVYLAIGNILFEARSFWIAVPAFAAFTALLVEDSRTERVTGAPAGRSA